MDAATAAILEAIPWGVFAVWLSECEAMNYVRRFASSRRVAVWRSLNWAANSPPLIAAAVAAPSSTPHETVCCAAAAWIAWRVRERWQSRDEREFDEEEQS